MSGYFDDKLRLAAAYLSGSDTNGDRASYYSAATLDEMRASSTACPTSGCGCLRPGSRRCWQIVGYSFDATRDLTQRREIREPWSDTGWARSRRSGALIDIG